MHLSKPFLWLSVYSKPIIYAVIFNISQTSADFELHYLYLSLNPVRISSPR